MDFSSPAHVLVVVHKTGTTQELLELVRDRGERGPCFFHVLVPNPSPEAWPQARVHQGMRDGERILAFALPLVEAAARHPTDGSVSRRHDPMDAIEEVLYGGDFDEIILAAPPPTRLSRRLRLDLASRVAHLGLPVTVARR
jgi:hypothetical protein